MADKTARQVPPSQGLRRDKFRLRKPGTLQGRRLAKAEDEDDYEGD